MAEKFDGGVADSTSTTNRCFCNDFGTKLGGKQRGFNPLAVFSQTVPVKCRYEARTLFSVRLRALDSSATSMLLR